MSKLNNDSLGDRMKGYENREAGRKLFTTLPIVARLDGRCFSNFTKGMSKPFDVRMMMLMQNTTSYLCEETVANCGYTQSDEITLIWYWPMGDGMPFFNGRIQKLVSVLASAATGYFVAHATALGLGDWLSKRPQFDCRVWNVPTLEEGADCFLWRELDCTKNAISSAAACYYSPEQLSYKNGSEKQEMLFQKGINFNDYPSAFKRGLYVQRTKTKRKFTAAELEVLPPLHNARKNPDLEVERIEYVRQTFPPLTKVENRVGVVYYGERPQISRQTWEECRQVVTNKGECE